MNSLTDRDPHAAIEAARRLVADDVLNQDNIDTLASTTLVDAGILAHDHSALDEGVHILERLAAQLPDKGTVAYCLANGLAAQADLDETRRPEWYPLTADKRRRAKQLWHAAGSEKSIPLEVKSRSYTNLGNSLLQAYRLIEAYDFYSKALECDSTNGVALTGAARVLLRLAQADSSSSQVLLAVAARHLKKANENPERIRELAGEQAYRVLSGLLDTHISAGELPDLSAASDYQRFVAKYRLSLAPTIEGLDLSLTRWDSLRIYSVTESANAGGGIPPLFGMFNILKSEYLVARHLAYSALNNTIPESGKYSDTLDYALYGTKSSTLTLAQRACLDLLDKVAVATSEYLGLPGNPSHVSFTNRWFAPRKSEGPLAWQPEIRNGISQGNTALLAISEVSGDIEAGGFLQLKRTMRNSSTHRFTILHDIGESPGRESRHVDHYSLTRFVEQLLETLQLTRAVLFYFVEMVALNEHLTHRDETYKVQLDIPDHDWIRSENG